MLTLGATQTEQPTSDLRQNMTNQTVQSIKHDVSAIRAQAVRLDLASREAQASQIKVVQLCWDLGDSLQSHKEASPETFDALLEGAGVPYGMAKAALKIRANAPSRDSLAWEGGLLRQALLCTIIPKAEPNPEGREIELCPPQDFRKWLNGWQSWHRKVEAGLAELNRDDLKRDTKALYTFLSEIHDGGAQG
jgi:hypothetical protein